MGFSEDPSKPLKMGCLRINAGLVRVAARAYESKGFLVAGLSTPYRFNSFPRRYPLYPRLWYPFWYPFYPAASVLVPPQSSVNEQFYLHLSKGLMFYFTQTEATDISQLTPRPSFMLGREAPQAQRTVPETVPKLMRNPAYGCLCHGEKNPEFSVFVVGFRAA